MKRVLVTGSNGFIGSAAVAALQRRGYEVHGVSRHHGEHADGVIEHRLDLLDAGATTDVVRGIAATHLLHLAWFTTHGEYWSSPLNEQWVSASEHLFRVFADAGGSRIVATGTCAEYDWSGGVCVEDETPIAPVTAYGAAKAALQRKLVALPISQVWARLFFLYGPYEPAGRFIPSTIRSLLRGEDVLLRNPSVRRDYLYVDDAGYALAQFVDGEATGAVNLGTGTAVPLAEIASSIAGQIGVPDRVQHSAEPPTEARLVGADTTRLNDTFGFRPRVSLAEGIRRSIAWWRSREERDRRAAAPAATKLPIPIAGPSITRKEIDYVADAAANGWYSNAYAYPARFERAFAEYLGVKHAVSLPSCTSAIHLALAALGIGPGDEVIVPDITWIATAAPIAYVGATPRFADIERDSWCMSPDSFESLITPRTRAVIPVDLYGNVARNDAIASIAERHGVAVLEDAAESIGAMRGDRLAGTFGLAGFYSFHGAKTLTTGEGGMLVSDDDAFVARVNVLRDHGRSPGDRPFDNAEVAFKYRMSALQAALGLAQLERVDELIARKREAFGWYAEELGGIDGITLNVEEPGTKSVFWMVTIIVDPGFGLDKDALRARMTERQIDTRPFFRPLSSLPAYEHLPEAAAARQRNEVAYAIAPYGLNLPSSLSLDRDQVAYVGKALREVLHR